jgi:hypothetical protein
MERRTDRSDSAPWESAEPTVRSIGERPAIGDGPVSLALWLRAGRVQRGMSLDDVAKITKIQPRILERLEAGRLDGLPAEVFVRGFIRSVARCVGLDEREALRRYAACGAMALGSAEMIPTEHSLGPATRALVDAMADLAPGSATAARATPRKMLAVEVEPPDGAVDSAASSARSGATSAGDLAVAMGLAAGSIVRPPSAIGEGRVEGRIAGPAIERRPEAAPVCAVDSEALVSPEAVAAEAAGADPGDADDDVDAAASGEMAASDDAAPADAATPLPLAAAVVAPPAHPSSAPSKKKKGRRAKRNKRRALAVGTPAAPSPVVKPAADATWAPRMPPPNTSSVPWRRPAYASAPSAVLPRLVIDDADPDSAELALEERAEKQAPRRSFLPPILLDREDRSARQGGLTLAVIILLIAATLTLSYLMRRPSASGDGMTLRGPDVSWPASKHV